MNGNFSVVRRWFPAGEDIGTLDNSTHLLSMADSQGTFVEWSVGGSRKRKRSRVFAGDLWVLSPGQPWWTYRGSDKTCIQLSISSEWLSQAMPSSFALWPQVQVRDLLIAQMLRTLADTAQTLPQNPTTYLYQESLVTTLILHLITHYGQSGEKSESALPLSSARLRAVSDYIAEHLSETISLTELAQLAGLSASQFSRRFRDTVGQTPHQFVTAMRVERAKELLTEGQHTLADVATLTGFADQSHLTRHVRRLVGVTPGTLQKR